MAFAGIMHFSIFPCHWVMSNDELYVDIELYSRTNKRGSEKETYWGPLDYIWRYY